jgi:hypothetical protein
MSEHDRGLEMNILSVTGVQSAKRNVKHNSIHFVFTVSINTKERLGVKVFIPLT